MGPEKNVARLAVLRVHTQPLNIGLVVTEPATSGKTGVAAPDRDILAKVDVDGNNLVRLIPPGIRADANVVRTGIVGSDW